MKLFLKYIYTKLMKHCLVLLKIKECLT